MWDNTLMSGQPESIKKFLIRNISRCNKMLLLTQGHPNTSFYIEVFFFYLALIQSIQITPDLKQIMPIFQNFLTDCSNLKNDLLRAPCMLSAHQFILYRSVLKSGKRFYLISNLICCSSKFSFNPA